MDEKRKLEIRRKILHFCFGIAMILIILFVPNIKWILFFLLIIGIMLSFICMYTKVPLLSFIIEKFERPKQKKVLPGKGMMFFVAGSLLVLKLFPLSIALASIAILTFSDPFFSIEKRTFNGFFKTKKFTNILIGFVSASIAASFFVSPVKALVASFFAIVAESITIFLGTEPVDDNILIPLIAGTALYLIPI